MRQICVSDAGIVLFGFCQRPFHGNCAEPAEQFPIQFLTGVRVLPIECTALFAHFTILYIQQGRQTGSSLRVQLTDLRRTIFLFAVSASLALVSNECGDNITVLTCGRLVRRLGMRQEQSSDRNTHPAKLFDIRFALLANGLQIGFTFLLKLSPAVRALHRSQ